MYTQEEYQARRDERIARLLAAADRKDKESEQARASAHAMAEVIPFGQLILVGHHSEGRDRNYRARIESKYRKGWESYEKAQELRSRAASAENNDAIYSDDPQAVDKLAGKLAELLELQATYKKINAAHAKYLKNPASLESSDLPESTKQMIRDYKPEYGWEPHPIPPYRLSNLSATIRQAKQRAESVAKKQAMEDKTETIGDVRIEYVPSENRIRIFYPARVDRDLFKALRSHGYRVLRSAGEGAFSAYYNNNALYFIREHLRK